MAANTSLIATKLSPPPARANLVLRPRLARLLDAGLRPECRLILISAPAGYGKSTLAAAWLGGLCGAHAWLSLEEAENDRIRFLAYLAEALETVAPEFGRYVGSLAGVPQMPGADTVAAELINSMPPLTEPFVLTFDDYHSITHPYHHDLVLFLIDHMPPNLHLMLVTREDPPLPLNRMRVRNEMTEVRMGDLRFTADEAGEFLRGLGLTLRDEAVASCTERTEGWAAGLQLAALSLQGRDVEETEAFLAAFGGTHRYIIDYLVDEVLRRQDSAMRVFLRRTAVLSRFTASLCDVVTGRSDSREILRKIEANNLFLIPLDGEREWFRYHHLFADSLRTELGKAERAEVHLRAAAWFETHGNLPEAVEQALAAGAMVEAARLIDAASLEMLSRSDREMATLCRWLESLPDEVLRANPGLSVGKPWSQFVTGRRREAEASLAGISSQQRAEMPPCHQGRLLSLEAVMASSRGEDLRAADLSREALAAMGEEADPMTRASTLNTLGGSLVHLGDTKGAESALREANELAKVFPGAFISVITASSLASLLDLCGRRREADRLCRPLYRAFVDELGRPSTYAGVLAGNLGVMAYEANDLFEARLLLETGLELRRAIGYFDDVHGEETLALTLDALGEGRAASEMCRAARMRSTSEDSSFSSASVEAEIARRHGEVAVAMRWAEEWRLSPDDAPNMQREFGYLTYLRLLLDTGRPGEAASLVERVAGKAESEGRLGRLIPLCVLQALALEALGRRGQAAESLQRAVRLAAPEEYVRAFLDQGSGVAPLLPLVRDAAPAFVDRVAAAFHAPDAGSQAAASPLVEPLTERESELLKLLAVGLSNEEISRRIYISLNTTKWHLKSIFGKLGVGNRVQAVTRARELGLVD